MTIFQAPEYDPRKARRKKIIISVIIAVVVVVAFFGWWFRYYPEERIAAKFFADLQKQDYKAAYGVWIADPNWEQHPNSHSQYPFQDFYRDWGPGGEWGLIRTYRIDGVTRPSGSNGVVVLATLNDRKEQTQVFIDLRDKTMSFSPFEVVQ